MREITNFSANTIACFENDTEALKMFNAHIIDASNRVYGKYTADEANQIIRNQFNRITGIDFKTASPMKRRQAWRRSGMEICALIEDVLVDRMNSGWNNENAFFAKYVEEVNIADGDKNEFFVPGDSNYILQVSKYAGNHHDIVRQKVLPGKAFSVETSWYVVKVYTDYELFMLGRVDFAGMVDLMYKSIEKYRLSALYSASMSMDGFLPSDMKLETAISAATKETIIEMIESVKATVGYDVVLVGTRVALQKLQNLVNYTMWSNDMKNEQNQKGILGFWEGYECFALDRVNAPGTRDSVFTADDNKKIYILPVNDEFKPIKRVNEGDVEYFDRGMTGDLQDRTIEAEVWYKEGIGIVIDELFGVIIEQ